MSGSVSSSRRCALRFSAGNHNVTYKTEFEDGVAVIENISANGCAIRGNSIPISANEKILLTINLEKGTEPVEVTCRIVRIDRDTSALQFMLISEENKQRIVRYFANKQRSEMKKS